MMQRYYFEIVPNGYEVLKSFALIYRVFCQIKACTIAKDYKRKRKPNNMTKISGHRQTKETMHALSLKVDTT